MKDIANYYDIVEIGSHPTIENPGKGLGIKTIAERKDLSTLFIAFGKKMNILKRLIIQTIQLLKFHLIIYP